MPIIPGTGIETLYQPDLLVNGANVAGWGVRMGSGFLDALTEPLTPKDVVENESRLEHGKRVVVGSPVYFKARELTLDFTIEGATPAEFEANKQSFLSAIYQVNVTIQVPKHSANVYRLIYKGKGTDYGMNWQRTFCHMMLKFEEPNPMNRGETEGVE